MTRKSQIEVENKLISIVQQNDQDFISLTDMVRGEEGSDHIRNWMRNRNTVEFLGLWESLNNPNFKPVEFDTFRKQAGLKKNWEKSSILCMIFGEVCKSYTSPLTLAVEYNE